MEKKTEPKKKAGGVHAGHRARLRRRFLNSGLDSFESHEILELLLYYAIPRRDVNETAHLLIDRFGSLSGVLDAPEKELQEVPGVGPATAHFLNLVPQLLTQMSRQFTQAVPFYMKSSKDVAEYLTNKLRVPLSPGQTLLVLTDRMNRVLAVLRYDRFEQLDIRELALQITAVLAGQCILIEHVPDCTDFPLPGRLNVLRDLAEKLALQTTPLWDYFTVDDLGHMPRSYVKTGQLLLL